jgi:hypothetical protein
MLTKHKYVILLILAIFLTLALVAYLHKLLKKPPTFHILIATAGRPVLRNMLDSLKYELTEHDAITIVFDGEKAKAKSTITPDWLEGHKSTVNIIEQIPNLGHWGHGIRNHYQDNLSPKNTFIMHADDDDVYIPGTFERLRKLCVDPNTLYITKMEYRDRPDVKIPSKNQNITQNDIGTPNGVIPTALAGKGRWLEANGGDFNYYNSIKDYANHIVFLDLITYSIEKYDRQA